ncbi:Uncharacterised protein [Shigella sonnei]|nr:hypothetical protein BvCmsSIP076_00876 [Escherichia coli]CSG09404.1 Uncharacterised protein [Shigella sonnei]
MHAAANTRQRKNTRGCQRRIHFGEQPRQVGFFADVVTAFNDKVRHKTSLRGKRENSVNLTGARAWE